jgi:UDP-glucose 4-epimerase
MRSLVTGGAGFIGRHLIQRLLVEDSAEIRVLDNLRRGQVSTLWNNRVEFVREDIRNVSAVRAALQGVDVVYHLAAQSNVLGAIQDVDYSFQTNVVGTFNLLSTASEMNIRRFIFTSSREVYGETEDLPVRESAPLNPKNAYGASKAAGEFYCRVFAQSGLETTVLRLANVYGSGDRDRVIPLFIQNALGGQPLVIYGDRKLLDFVWVGDVVDALLLAQSQSLAGKTVNIGSGCGTTLTELAGRILDITGSSSPLHFAPARSVEVDRFVADIQLAKGIGYRAPADPLSNLQEVIRSTASDPAKPPSS